jgi:DNA-binding HxlR family transcriptional regulator
MAKNRHTNYENCPIEAALEFIGGKWKPVLLVRLLEGTKRFNEFRKLYPGIRQRMLTRQLRELEKDGLVTRKVYAEIPPKVEYSITDFGRTLEPLLRSLIQWGNTHALSKNNDEI